MSTRSQEARALLRADLIQISANVKRRVAYITQKTKQYESLEARRFRDRIIDAATETERICYAICDAFDNVDKINAIASVNKTDADAKRVKGVLEHLLDLRKQYYQAEARYGEVEQAYTNYAVQQGAVLLFEGLDDE